MNKEEQMRTIPKKIYLVMEEKCYGYDQPVKAYVTRSKAEQVCKEYNTNNKRYQMFIGEIELEDE
jgi:hypothetical protein